MRKALVCPNCILPSIKPVSTIADSASTTLSAFMPVQYECSVCHYIGPAISIDASKIEKVSSKVGKTTKFEKGEKTITEKKTSDKFQPTLKIIMAYTIVVIVLWPFFILFYPYIPEEIFNVILGILVVLGVLDFFLWGYVIFYKTFTK